MQKQFYFLSPVEVVKVTVHNLQEVAEWCGGQVATTPSRKNPGRMDSYVWVPTPKGTAISWAFPGMYVTKRLVRTVNDQFKATYAVFRKDYFDKNYFENPTLAVDETWTRAEKVEQSKKAQQEKQNPVPKQKAVGVSPADMAKMMGTSREERQTLLENAETVDLPTATISVELDPTKDAPIEEIVEAAEMVKEIIPGAEVVTVEVGGAA